jgi:flagellar protein FlgJ
MVGMASNETGYGNPQYTVGYNFFGIKRGVGWSGAITQSRTWEVIGGQRIETWAEFRAYDTPADSFADFCNFLESNQRYSGIDPSSGRYRPDWDVVRLRGNRDQLPRRDWCERFLTRMITAGYATDPDYVSKIMAIIDQWHLADQGAPSGS